MKKIVKLTESDLMKIVKRVVKENDMDNEGSGRYMFFSNLQQMKRQCEYLLDFDQDQVEEILNNGHDWAQDHISEAKNNMDQVFDFLMNEIKGDGDQHEESDFTINEAEHKPTNPKLWSSCLSWAKSRYKVCPSAYCNGAASKRYKSKGGSWKTVKK
jgi:hypothetical protein